MSYILVEIYSEDCAGTFSEVYADSLDKQIRPMQRAEGFLVNVVTPEPGDLRAGIRGGSDGGRVILPPNSRGGPPAVRRVGWVGRRYFFFVPPISQGVRGPWPIRGFHSDGMAGRYVVGRRTHKKAGQTRDGRRATQAEIGGVLGPGGDGEVQILKTAMSLGHLQNGHVTSATPEPEERHMGTRRFVYFTTKIWHCKNFRGGLNICGQPRRHTYLARYMRGRKKKRARKRPSHFRQPFRGSGCSLLFARRVSKSSDLVGGAQACALPSGSEC